MGRRHVAAQPGQTRLPRLRTQEKTGHKHHPQDHEEEDPHPGMVSDNRSTRLSAEVAPEFTLSTYNPNPAHIERATRPIQLDRLFRDQGEYTHQHHALGLSKKEKF